MNEANILQALRKYELTENEARIYLFLLKESEGWSVVKLARELGLGRTPIYNALERLEKKELVVKVQIKGGFNYQATEPSNLEKWWQKKKNEVAQLSGKLDDVVSSLTNLGMPNGYSSKVSYYSGPEGIKQMANNLTKAEGELLIYEAREEMLTLVPYEEAEEVRTELVKKQIMVNQLTNYQLIKPFTRQEDLVKDWWNVRYISPEILTIEFETVIYNDVYMMYSYEEGDIFGVEIRNPYLVQMQKQVFKVMQRLATPLIKLDDFGGAGVEEVKAGVEQMRESDEQGQKGDVKGGESEDIQRKVEEDQDRGREVKETETLDEGEIGVKEWKLGSKEGEKLSSSLDERNEWRKLGLSNMFLKSERDRK